MPRPLLKPIQKTERELDILSLTDSEKRSDLKIGTEDQMKIDRLLRRQRSKEYVETVRRLDAGGHVHNEQKVREIIGAITEEFPEIEISAILMGVVAICYLGDPYEVHTLDLYADIIEHYKVGHPLPGGLECARGIAMHGGYEFIEVYTNCICAVSADGSVSVIKGRK